MFSDLNKRSNLFLTSGFAFDPVICPTRFFKLFASVKSTGGAGAAGVLTELFIESVF